MIHLGGHGIDATIDDPRALARAHRSFGYRAAYCPEVNARDSAKIRAIRDAFAAEDVVIAEVGAWCNLIDPDDAIRLANIRFGSGERLPSSHFGDALKTMEAAETILARALLDRQKPWAAAPDVPEAQT